MSKEQAVRKHLKKRGNGAVHLLTLDEQNANLGTDRGRGALATSLKDYGPGRSILIDKDGKVIAGNKTLEEARQQGFNDKDVVIIKTDGSKLVAVQRTDLSLDDPKARGLAIADNRVAELDLKWDTAKLADFAKELDLTPFFSADELADLLGDQNATASDGSVLAAIDVTIDEPTHKTEHGQVWHVGEHLLIIADVINEWPMWINYLKNDVLFCPYPGPLVPLTATAKSLIMVQPDNYIAGHILDQYAAVHGEASCQR
jgi:hypothetical protein